MVHLAEFYTESEMLVQLVVLLDWLLAVSGPPGYPLLTVIGVL